LGALGDDQLEWLEKYVTKLGGSTPIVVFAHVPLWAVYPQWGWATGDGERALSYLKRFGSVTVLNDHIHQILQQGRGQHHLPHRRVHCLAAARARRGIVPLADDGPGGPLALGLGARRHVRARPEPTRDRRRDARIIAAPLPADHRAEHTIDTRRRVFWGPRPRIPPFLLALSLF
jgi:hypothetical protein